jgi:hypothetical protein
MKLNSQMLQFATKSLKSVVRPYIDRWHLRPLIDKWRNKSGRVGPDLYINADQFLGFRPPLQQLMLRAAATRFYRPSDHLEIRGFHTPKERQILYALARWLPGPIIEIGSWCGLSTTAIAQGIRDSGERKSFHTYDLALTLDNIRPVDGGMGLFLDGDDVPHGVCTEELYQRDILPVLSAPGSSQGELRKNLERLGLTELVSIHVGDFRSFAPMVGGFVFCDSLHDLHEISCNAPALRHFLRPGSILACHDIVIDPKLLAAVRASLPLGYGVSVDWLHIAEVVKDDDRIVLDRDVAEGLEQEANLAAMPWEDFEHLVRQLFEWEFGRHGAEVRLTRASRDRGVDAIIFDPDPLRGGKFVIQAKRYTLPVDVAAVRDLYGTLINEGANRGILITTSHYSPDAYAFARDKPISLLTGADLIDMLRRHGRRYRIDLEEARHANKHAY